MICFIHHCRCDLFDSTSIYLSFCHLVMDSSRTRAATSAGPPSLSSYDNRESVVYWFSFSLLYVTSSSIRHIISLRESVLFIGTPSVTLALGAFTATTVYVCILFHYSLERVCVVYWYSFSPLYVTSSSICHIISLRESVLLIGTPSVTLALSAFTTVRQ